MESIWSTFFSPVSVSFTSEFVNSVAANIYNPSLLYSTLIIAIVLTKGYGRNMAIAIGRKILHEPSKKIWRAVRLIKPRQIMYYGLRWGIPLHQLKDLLLLHRAVLKNRPKHTQTRTNSRKNSKKQTLRAKSLNSTVTLYRKLPWRLLSRGWGKMMGWNLPVSLREPVLGLYIWMTDVQLHEAHDGDLKNYKNLSEFFRRQLKPNLRTINTRTPITSPADGKVLHFGKVENGIVEQVKDVNYTIRAFLGPHPCRSADNRASTPTNATTTSTNTASTHDRLGHSNDTKSGGQKVKSGSRSRSEMKGKGRSESCYMEDDEVYQRGMNLAPGNSLYHCIVYLAPGDYHRFHSPTDWSIAHRRHFPGELLSVQPMVARFIQGLFSLNERVVYTGTWKYGYFSYTAVGATNVGSIKMYMDEDLETNTYRTHSKHLYNDKWFLNEEGTDSISVKKGEMLGEFNLGSTIVIMFEAPSNFEFTVQPGQKVQYGQSMGQFVHNTELK